MKVPLCCHCFRERLIWSLSVCWTSCSSDQAAAAGDGGTVKNGSKMVQRSSKNAQNGSIDGWFDGKMVSNWIFFASKVWPICHHRNSTRHSDWPISMMSSWQCPPRPGCGVRGWIDRKCDGCLANISYQFYLILWYFMHAKHFQCRNKMKQATQTTFQHIFYTLCEFRWFWENRRISNWPNVAPMASHGILAQNLSFEMPTMMSLDGRGSAEVCASPEFL